MFNPTIIEGRALDHIGNRSDTAIRGEAVQDQPHDQPANHRDHKDQIPWQPFGKAVQHPHIIHAIKPALKGIDAFAEKQGRETRRDPDHKRDQPELELAWTFIAQDLPARF